MSAETRDFITWLLGTIVTFSVILGLGVRYILIPYLREHLIKPMKQVEKQVTENGHSNIQPTVPDLISDVRADLRDLSDRFNGHLDWAENNFTRLDRHVHELDKRRHRPWIRISGRRR